MKTKSQYTQIVEAYKELGTIQAVVKQLRVSEVKVRRVLITEGLWSSRTSREVAKYMDEGLSDAEIADAIGVTVNAVRAYMPYKRGLYSEDEQSPEAARSENYRRRNSQNANNQKHPQSGTKGEVRLKIENNMPGKTESVTADKLYHGIMDKPPCVMKLRLELDIEGADPAILKTYGKAQNGIIREVLVPADITLHSLHFLIQRAFGWTNSHLHHFCFPTEVQDMLLSAVSTDGVESASFYDWEKLAGIYFRFPTEDENEIYWDDDYDGDESVKSWMRKKYRAPYRYGGFSEHYLECKNAAEYFRKSNPTIQPVISFAEYQAAKESNCTIEHIELPVDNVPVEDMGRTIQVNLFELLERLPLIDLVFPQNVVLPDNWEEQIITLIEAASNQATGSNDKLRELQYALMRAVKLYEKDEDSGSRAYAQTFKEYKQYVNEFDPTPIPLSSVLNYRYDYGDGWEVNITCEEVYYTKQGLGYPNPSMPGFLLVPITDKEYRELTEGFDQTNKPVKETLRAQISIVTNTGKPICVAADGLDVMDDVGGFSGYCDFLTRIHEGSEEEQESSRSWARGQGWTGRKIKPEHIL